MTSTEAITVRMAVPDDLPSIIDVCGRALAWSDAGSDEAFFRWKHLDNPFGASPIWVAEDPSTDDAPIVGVRAMMRWALRHPDGTVLAMVRAVDTATLPSHQGRGIFSRLTREAVETLTADGASAVFNTPNDKSRPGYLKLGWYQMGRVPVSFRPRTPAALPTMVRSRVAADKWGIATDVGLAPAEAFDDPGPIDRAIAATPVRSGLATPLSIGYLRWRVGFEPLAARVLPLGSSLGDGFIVFRVRQRGGLRQLSLLHVVGGASAATRRRAVRRLLRATGTDVAMAAGSPLGLIGGLVPLPRSGPILTWRPLADPATPESSDLDLELGAIELF